MATHKIYATVTRVRHDDVDCDGETGWVDLDWDSGRTIHDDISAVNPLHEITDDELAESGLTFEEWLAEVTAGYENYGDDNYYSQDEYMTGHSLLNGYTDMIALHYWQEDD